jgi:arabinosyltransferase C
MVYAAWMRQAMDGHLLMDNRFAVDPQPGLTIHLYFFLLGQIARFTGIAMAAALGKMAFSALFIFLAYRLIQKTTANVYTTKLALALVTLGGGIGFLVWENFGPEMERQGPFQSLLGALKVPGVPTDVWQPEGFVFPSMLTNGLFMVSLCLILYTFICFLRCRDSWKPVLPGALAFGALMNIHSYDALLIAMVMVAFLVMQVARKAISGAWVGRALVIALGAVPPALWFMHVLQNDKVFQERAATPTYSANFKVLFFGYCLMILLAGLCFIRKEASQNKRLVLGAVLGVVTLAGLFALSPPPGFDGYYMSMAAWIGVYALVLVACGLLAREAPAANLVVAWALVGIVAPYFPALFERKLTMGLSVPWAILAAVGLATVTLDKDRAKRNLITVLTILVLSGTSLRWFFREVDLIRLNVSNTTLHPVYLTRDMQSIVDYLNTHEQGTRRVVIAMPGVAQKDPELIDTFRTPSIPDLNPILSGLTGVYTYAGHWSETPNYGDRRNDALKVFLAQTPENERSEILSRVSPNYLVAPDEQAFPGVADLEKLGTVVAGGNQFKLIKLR